jgi:hypothetical protein
VVVKSEAVFEEASSFGHLESAQIYRTRIGGTACCVGYSESRYQYTDACILYMLIFMYMCGCVSVIFLILLSVKLSTFSRQAEGRYILGFFG